MFCLTCRKRSINGWIRLYGEYSVTCNICTEKYNQNSDIKIGVMVECGHFFCTICLDNWLVKSWSNLSSRLEPLNDYMDDPRVINTSIFDQDMISDLILPLSNANIIDYNQYDRNILMRLIFSFALHLNQESLIDIIQLIEHYYHQEITNIRQMPSTPPHPPPPPSTTPRTTPLATPINEENDNNEAILIRNDSSDTLHTLINEHQIEPIMDREIEIELETPLQISNNDINSDTESPDTFIHNDNAIETTEETQRDTRNNSNSNNRRRLRRYRIIHLETRPYVPLNCITFVQQITGNQSASSEQICFTVERSRIFWSPGFFKNSIPHNRNCAFCNNRSHSWIRHNSNVLWIPCCRLPINNYWF